MASISAFLKRFQPFSALPDNELDRIQQVARSVKYAKGEAVFSEGEEANNVWVLKSGRIDIYKYNSEGRPLALETISEGEMFGTLCRLGGDGRSYPCTSVAAIESEAISFPDSVFLDQYKKYPGFITGVCSLCSTRLNQMRDLSCKTQEPVEVRIARTLLELSKRHGKTIPLTKREIAELSATTVETAIRTMSRFQKQGWITSQRGRVMIENSRQIENLLG